MRITYFFLVTSVILFMNVKKCLFYWQKANTIAINMFFMNK